jgi:hypothetical protein
MSGWGCPHEDKDACTRLHGKPCDPGMRGCILHGRFRFANDDKNRPVCPRDEVEDEGS